MQDGADAVRLQRRRRLVFFVRSFHWYTSTLRSIRSGRLPIRSPYMCERSKGTSVPPSTKLGLSRKSAPCAWIMWPSNFGATCADDTFVGVIKTKGELSLLVPAHVTSAVESSADVDLKVDGGWVGLEVEGPMPFDLVGIMAKLANTLAAAEISLLAQSSFDTDYIFVKEDNKDRATIALETSGCVVKV